MKKSLLSLACMVLSVIAFSQSKYLLKTDELMARIAQGKDTVYVINFWATWCGPCVKELPHFEKLNESFKTEKVKVLLVSVDFKSQFESKVVPFIKKRNFKTELFLLDEKDQQGYIEKIDKSWSGAIPATLFIKAGQRKFSEQEYDYKTLLTEYLNFKAS